MSKICNNCNYQNKDEYNYCEQCGNILLTKNNIVQDEKYKTTSLVWGILSLFLGIITSIIGIVYGIKYRGKYNKTCPGYTISLVTFILKTLIYPIAIYITITVFLPLWLIWQLIE